jgi:hypothetical protein
MVAACGSVPDDPGPRVFPPAGVIQGSVLYQGPRPCSSNGHIVGNAILLVFDRRNPPPPVGLATTPVNFGDVTGDRLFPDEPRYTGSEVYCPSQNGFTETVTVTAPFAIAPFGLQVEGKILGGSYLIEAFFDYTGDFRPTFKFANLPERGDVGGGDIDTTDALKPTNAGNPNYTPHFLQVDVGIPEPLQAGQTIPTYDIPSTGFVADNVNVTVGEVLGQTRPYLYAQGVAYGGSILSADGSTLVLSPVQDSSRPSQNQNGIAGTAETEANYMPVLTIPQDLATLSPPPSGPIAGVPAPASANLFESALPHLKLVFGVPPSEVSCASGGGCPQSAALGAVNPFHFQLDPSATPAGAFPVWQNASFDSDAQAWMPLLIPEGQGVPMLWPLVILTKLVDSTLPSHPEDPASLTAQGAPGQPVVIMQGVTMFGPPQANPLGASEGDTLLNTALAGGIGGVPNALFDATTQRPAVTLQDHLMVALRPSVICFSHLFDNPPTTGGVLVTPYTSANQADFGNPTPATGPIVPTDLLSNADPSRFAAKSLIGAVQYGCMPKGRYAINVVYPDGQAWTVPNEAGACSGTEGQTDYQGMTCTIKPRPVLYSQGNRAVVEVVGPVNPRSCVEPGPAATPQPACAPDWGGNCPAGAPGDIAPATAPAFAVPADCAVAMPGQ